MSISIIMSVFNQERTLESSIKSILNQSHTNFEFLICDDFSNDKSLKIIKKYMQFDSRIKLFQNEKNIGLTKSLNFLISKSKFDYIARQDGDDISLNTRLEKQINELKNNNIEFCITRAINQQTKKKIPGISFYLPIKFQFKFKNPFVHGTLLITKEALKKVNFYDEDFYYAQDYKLFSELLKINVKYKYINEPLYILNTANNMSSNNIIEQTYYANQVKKNYKIGYF